jgi:hypothetical protein
MAQPTEEANIKKIYDIFDLIARQAYIASRLHYLNFFGASRYYKYSGKN